MDWYGFAAKIRQIRVIRVPNSQKNCDLSKNTYFWAGTGLISLSNHSLYQAVIIHQNKFSPDAIGTIFRHLRRFFERSIFYFLCTIFYN